MNSSLRYVLTFQSCTENVTHTHHIYHFQFQLIFVYSSAISNVVSASIIFTVARSLYSYATLQSL